MSNQSVFEDMIEYFAGFLIIVGFIFVILPGKYPRLSILIVPMIALLFLAGNVPNWIIISWIISGGVWFTTPIWAPLSNGDAPFTKPD